MIKVPPEVTSHLRNFLLEPLQLEEQKVWCQMVFDDGSVTQGKYLNAGIINLPESIKNVALEFLKDTHREEGVLMIWGAGVILVKKARLLLLKRGETLRLHNF